MKKILSIVLSSFIVLGMFLFSGCDTAFNPDGKDYQQTISVSFSSSSISMKVDDIKTVKINCNCDLSEIYYSVSSNNTSIATVSKTTDGISVKAQSVGSTIINLRSDYGNDTLTVTVNYTSVSLNTTNYKNYISFQNSRSGNNITVKVSPVNKKYQLSFSTTVTVTVYGTYKYYPSASRWAGQSPNTSFMGVSRTIFLSDSTMSKTEDFTQTIKNQCPGYAFVSFTISSVTVSVSTMIGTVKY